MQLVLRNNMQRKLHPLKFALWVSLASISMLFAGFMSAYIVRQAAGNWLEFSLPTLFTISTFVILLSSVAIHGALISFRKGKEFFYKGSLILAILLGFVFIVLQYQGWISLLAMGIDLKGNPSGAFVYVISGVHVAHVIAGLAAIAVAIVHAWGLPFKPTEVRLNRLEITTQYWHYVDLLWVVLFLFLKFYR